jgi:hypothetical protein
MLNRKQGLHAPNYDFPVYDLHGCPTFFFHHPIIEADLSLGSTFEPLTIE